MKTVLVWGVRKGACSEVVRALASENQRLLLTGPDVTHLAELDASLPQSELHRYRQSPAEDHLLAEWVAEQGVGLDAVVLFPPPPEPAAILTPRSVHARNVDVCVLQPVELVRQLVPVLRKGRGSKNVLGVLDWVSPLKPPERVDGWLPAVWQRLLPELADELAPQQVHVNLLRLGAVLDELVSEAVHSGEPDAERVAARVKAMAERAPGGVLLDPGDVAALVCAWLSPPLNHLSGQCLDHPRR